MECTIAVELLRLLSADSPDHLFQAPTKLRLFGRDDYLDKGVDTHDGKIRLRFCIIDQVQVHQLLQLQVIRLQQQKHIAICAMNAICRV